MLDTTKTRFYVRTMSKSKSSDILDKAIAEAAPPTAAPDPIPSARGEVTRGDNNPPDLLQSAPDLLARLGVDYKQLAEDAVTLRREMRGDVEGIPGVPPKIETDAENGIVAAYMERLRTTIKTANAYREKEKAPYLAAERAAQAHFRLILDPLEKTQEIVQKRGDDYIARKAATERAERQRELDAANDVAAKAARVAEANRLAAEELERAAARARKPENIERLGQAAEAKSVEASAATINEMIANTQAETAAVAAAAPTADLVRTRFETGHMSTGKQVPYVEIVDANLLDTKALWPFIKEEHKLAALKKWAENSSHKRTMAGAIIEMRDKADYR